MRLPTMLLAVLTLLCACGEPFLNPPVACPVRTFPFMLTTTPRGAMPCDFGEFPFSVAYAPRVDTTRDRDAMDYAFARGRVTVTAAASSIILCPGSGQAICTGGAPEITTVISDTGVLSYQGVFVTDEIVLRAGGMTKTTLPLVYENFGPGNTCRIDISTEFSCQAEVR